MNSIFFNRPQQRAILSMPTTGYHVWGRGTGKSEGPGAATLAEWAENMPRSAIGIVGATYMQLLDRTLPPLYRAWERMGYLRNVHYWVRRKPPKELNIPLPFYAPETDEHAIYWQNGACFALISQDRPGSANGKTLDAIYGDEAKLLNKAKFDGEISKAIRGNVKEFASYSGHGGTLFLTDMPTTPEAKWILDKQEDMKLYVVKNGERITMERLNHLIVNHQVEINRLYNRYYQATTPEQSNTLSRKITSQERQLNELRKETVLYTEASSLENIHFLGLHTVKRWKRDDLDVVFRTQVLNERLYQIDNGFYPNLDTTAHTYDKYDYNQVDAAELWLPDGVRKGCMNDGDIQRNEPLDIAMDAGARINCLVVGQQHASEYRVLNGLYVKHPKRMLDVLEDFATYYESHRNKTVNFHYDHTFVGTDASRVYSYADEVNRHLTAKGWKVNMINIGQQPGHETRYRMWQGVLREDTDKYKVVRFNRNNCAQLLIAMQCAGVLQGSKGIQKDKRPEKRSDVPQEEATHFTDALDTLYIGKFQYAMGYAPTTTEAFFGA